MLPKPESCQGCPAFALGQSFVPGEGPLTASIALVGQGPGRVEAWSGRPFVGPSGHVLERWLSQAGIRRKDCFVTNVVQCWLPGDRSPTKRERDYCTSHHTYPELAHLPNLTVVVPIGVPAARSLLGEDTKETSFCTIFQKENTFAANLVSTEIKGLRPPEVPSNSEPRLGPSTGTGGSEGEGVSPTLDP